jgi:protease YdgD
VERELNVYGYVDRRQFADPSKFPLANLVGKVEFSNQQYCTGTLVGPNIVLTARHCFTDETGALMPGRITGIFRVGLQHNAWRGEAAFLHVWTGENPMEDWALIKLNEPLGNEVGWLHVSSADHRGSLPMLNAFKMVAYSSDKFEFYPGIDNMCSLEDYDANALVYVTSCSGEAGASGAAIVDDRNEVVAVFTSAYEQPLPTVRPIANFDPRYPNYALPSTVFYEAWRTLPGVW